MATQDFATSTTDELHDRIDRAHERFASLLGEVPADLTVGEWTGKELVAHLVNVVNRYNEFEPGRLAADPRGVDEINQRELESIRDRTLGDLLADLDDEMRSFRSSWGPERGIPLDTPLPFHGGATIDVQSGLINLVGEYLIHGLDIARAIGRPWPIDDRDAVLLAGFGTQILPYYVSQTNTEDLLLHLDLEGMVPWALEVHGPTAAARPAAGTTDSDADVVLRGLPVAVPLLFYGRIGPTDLGAHGLDVVGGRHPERVDLLADLFEVP